MRTTITFVLLLMLSALVHAQKQNNNWCFGAEAGLSFNGTLPTPFSSKINSFEAVATMSNRYTGKLMFYTTGGTVWDGNHNVMPNGRHIGYDSTGSIIGTTAQGALIVPFVNDTNKFYIFNISPGGGLSDGKLGYSVLDMRLNGGLGDIVAGQKAIPIDSYYAEAMTVVPKCNGYWLMLVKRRSITYHAYEITAAGINLTPVSSQVSYQYGPVEVASIKVSPDRKKLAIASFNNHVSSGVSRISYTAIHDFNVITGKLSNGMLIDTLDNQGNFYSCAFSSNSNLFYASVYHVGNPSSIIQYNLSLGTAAQINAAKHTVATSPELYSGMQLGPDSNIYISKFRSLALAQISDVNKVFPGCMYVDDAVIFDSTRLLFGLPQHIFFAEVPKPVLANVDTSICLEYPVTFRGRTNVNDYYWQDGSTKDTFTIANEGVYWVRSLDDDCFLYTDTFVVSNKVDTTHSRVDTSICFDEVLEVAANNISPRATYLWSNQDTGKQITLVQEGLVWVRINEPCRIATDTTMFSFRGIPAVLRNDTTICIGDTLLLANNNQPPGVDYKWSTGSTDSVIKVGSKGVYTLSISYQGCADTAEMELTQYTALSLNLGGDTKLCRGDELTLSNLSDRVDDTKYRWQSGSTDETYNVTQPGKYILTITNICDTLTDSVTVTTRNCHFFFPSAFTPNGDGRNDIAKMVGDIAVVTNFRLRIINRWGEVVFLSNNPSQGWDGSYKGQKAEVGTYFYQIQYNYQGEKELMKGDILLMR